MLRDIDGIRTATLRAHRRRPTAPDTTWSLQMARDMPASAQPLGRSCEVIGAEILYAARREMALKLAMR